MTGRTQGSKQKPYRYYHASPACRIPSSDETMRRTIPAELIERAVLAAVRETLAAVPNLRARVKTAVQEQLAAIQRDSGGEIQDLLKQRGQIAAQIEFVIDELSVIGRDAAKRKISQLEAQLATLDDRLAKAAAANAGAKVDVDAAVDQIMHRLDDIGRRLDTLPPHSLRSLLSIIIARLEVDLETRTFELELALPNWAVFDQKEFEARMGLDEKFLRRTSAKARGAIDGMLAAFDCEPRDRSCYDCRRLKRAA